MPNARIRKYQNLKTRKFKTTKSPKIRQRELNDSRTLKDPWGSFREINAEKGNKHLGIRRENAGTRGRDSRALEDSNSTGSCIRHVRIHRVVKPSLRHRSLASRRSRSYSTRDTNSALYHLAIYPLCGSPSAGGFMSTNRRVASRLSWHYPAGQGDYIYISDVRYTERWSKRWG